MPVECQNDGAGQPGGPAPITVTDEGL